MRALTRLFRRASGSVPDEGPEVPRGPPPRPERLTYAVGDIHGRLDLLERMIDEIARDAGTRPHDIVFLGDYVDRGPESAGVLRLLHELDTGQSAGAGQAGDNGQASQPAQPPARITCLMGNHDYMMLHFVADPEDGVNWLLVGGGETMASFGIPSVPLTGGNGGSVVERVSAQAAALAAALGDDLTDWLAGRPLWWRSGDLVAVHALTDPEKPMEEQDDEVLLWARPGRDLAPRVDGAWVVHGHTPVAEPTLRARHINVDTGAFRGGPLTAAVFAPGEAVRFLPVASSGAQNA